MPENHLEREQIFPYSSQKTNAAHTLILDLKLQKYKTNLFFKPLRLWFSRHHDGGRRVHVAGTESAIELKKKDDSWAEAEV
jgi:hypothetical protein